MQKYNADYFPHDADFMDDQRVRVLRNQHGQTGYATLCMLLETLAKSQHFMLLWNAEECLFLSGRFGMEHTELTQVVKLLVKLKMLKLKKGVLTCPELSMRLECVLNKRKAGRDAKKPTKKRRMKKLLAAMNKDIKESGAEMQQSKVKESKEKEIKAEAAALAFEKISEESAEGDMDEIKKPTRSVGQVDHIGHTAEVGWKVLQVWRNAYARENKGATYALSPEDVKVLQAIEAAVPVGSDADAWITRSINELFERPSKPQTLRYCKNKLLEDHAIWEEHRGVAAVREQHPALTRRMESVFLPGHVDKLYQKHAPEKLQEIFTRVAECGYEAAEFRTKFIERCG